jgi:hypothetical protein
MLVDRAGSDVLDKSIVNQQVENTMELILTAPWYIWWMRRQFVHGEKVPTSSIAAMSIRVITTNNIRAMRKNLVNKKCLDMWLVNVDATFNP